MIWLAIFVVAFVVASIASFRRPGIAVACIILMFGIEQLFQSQSAIFIARSYLINVAIGIMALIACFGIVARREFSFQVGDSQKLVLLLFAYVFLSRIWTLSPTYFDQYYWNGIPYMVLFFVLGPFLTAQSMTLAEGIKWTQRIGSVLIVLVVLVVDWSGRGIEMAAPVMNQGQLTRAAPPLALASAAANVGILSLLLLPKRLLGKMAAVAVAALCCYVVYRTQSRGQLIAFGLTVFVMYPVANSGLQRGGIAHAAVGIVLLVASLFAVMSYADLGTVNRWQGDRVEGAMSGRLYLVKSLLREWVNGGIGAWLFGLGAASGFAVSGTYAHNVPVEVLCELGVVGAAVFLRFYSLVASNAMATVSRAMKTGQASRESLGLIGMLVFNSMLMFKQGSLFGWPVIFFYGIVVCQLPRVSLGTRPVVLRSACGKDRPGAS